MQNLTLLFAFVCGKNVESLFEDHHFADDLMYVDSITPLKAGEREARRLVNQEHAEDSENDEDDAQSSATPYKPSVLGAIIVGGPMLLLPVLLWALPKGIEKVRTMIEGKTWLRPAVYAVSIVLGLAFVALAPETSEDDASDENDDDNVPQASESGYMAKLTAFLPMFGFAVLAFGASVVFYFKHDLIGGYEKLVELAVMAVGLVAQLAVSMI